MRPSLALPLSLAGSVVAQQQTYTVEPDTVDQSTRDYWCQQQQTQCPLICLQTSARSSETRQNDCSASDLSFSCVCSNGLSPNVSQYSQTLPYFICTEWGNQCVSDCGTDNSCSSDCREDNPCGALDPSPPNRTATMSQSSTKEGGDSPTLYSGFADASQPTGGVAAAVRVPSVLEFGPTGGVMVVFGAFFLSFALLL